MAEPGPGAADELINMTGIADLARVTRPAVTNWRKRYDDFPEPAAQTGGANMFRLADVLAWLDRHHKRRATASFENALWRAFDSLRGIVDPPSAIDLVATLMILLSLVERGLLPSFPTASFLRESFEDNFSETLRRAHEEARSILPLPELLRLDPAVVRAGSRIAGRVKEAADAGGVIAAFEALLSDWQRASSATVAAPNSVARLLIRLAAPFGRVVYDPRCGCGELLVAAGAVSNNRYHDLRLVGAERDPLAQRIARMNLLLHGLNGEVRNADVLASGHDADVEADVVLCLTPFGARWEPQTQLDPERWIGGRPSGQDADMAWVQHSIARLSPDGRAYLIVRPALAFNGGGTQQIRRELLRRGCIHAVIALPAGLWTGTRIGVSIWVVGRPATAGDEVLFVDASDRYTRVGRQRAEIGADDLDEITGCYAAWQRGRDLPGGVKARVVGIDELLEDPNLSPGHWLTRPSTSPAERREKLLTAVRRRELARQALGRTTAEQPPFRAEPALGSPERASIRELIDRGHASLIRSRRLPRDGISRGPVPLIAGGDIRDDWTVEPGQLIDASTFETDLTMTEPGDLLIVGEGLFRVGVDWKGGAITAAPVHILRLNRNLFDPLVTALLLARSAPGLQVSNSGIRHVDLYRLELPLLPTQSLERLSKLLKTLSTQQRDALEFVGATRELVVDLVDAISAGVMDIGEAPTTKDAAR